MPQNQWEVCQELIDLEIQYKLGLISKSQLLNELNLIQVFVVDVFMIEIIEEKL